MASPAKPSTKKKSIAEASLLSIGEKAPSFRLPTDQDRVLSLQDFKGKWLVLFFYPKDLTSGCTQEACDFKDYRGAFTKLGAVILGLSKDPVKSHQKFVEKYGLPFELLSDEDTKVCQAYGVWKEKSMYGRKYMGVERTTFVIDPTGKIAQIYSKVKVPDHVEQVLKDLKVLVSEYQ